MITNDYKTKNTKVYSLRLNAELFETIRKRAEVNKRSIAKEIEFALEQYLKQN